MKITLIEVFMFEKEINALFAMSIPFPLKFRLETKFVPPLQAAGKLINENMMRIALENGATKTERGWEYEKGEDGEVIDKEGYKNFLTKNDAFLADEANSIEIEHTIREELFAGLVTGPGFPSPSVISKFLE